MWSWWQLVPGRMPLRAKNTASGEPMQKKFSTCETNSAKITPRKHLKYGALSFLWGLAIIMHTKQQTPQNKGHSIWQSAIDLFCSSS